MSTIVATNITSPLGLTTDSNCEAVKAGRTALKVMDGCLGVSGRFCVGMFDEAAREKLTPEGFSWFESLLMHSVADALSRCDVDPASPRTALIVGTSTAGVGELGEVPEKDGVWLAPGLAVAKVARALGFVSTPLVASTACISGATAQMLAERLLAAGDFDAAVVCGVDVLSAFVLAGFSSFKALSPTFCRPFDIERLGLNIGECAATLVIKNTDVPGWRIAAGCLNNDAYHVSAPEPGGDGMRRSIERVLTPELRESLACVTAHGTATMFNDQMESKGIEAAGLSNLPLTALKGHYGHTFGASGLLEAIVTMRLLDEGLVPPVHGFSELGVSGRINVCSRPVHTDGRAFIKTQSGFGGGNASVVYSRTSATASALAPVSCAAMRSLSITPDRFVLDGSPVPLESKGADAVTEIFKKFVADGSRFFKMDLYSRLAYAGTALLAKDTLEGTAPEERACIIFTGNGSVLADRKHLASFSTPGEFYPSPAVFINTLPNIVLGEIAVRFGVKGETSLVMLPGRDDALMDRIVDLTVRSTRPAAVICGWVDCGSEDSFEADLKLIKTR